MTRRFARRLTSSFVLLLAAACQSPELSSGRAWVVPDQDQGARQHSDPEPGSEPERTYRSLTGVERDALAQAQALDPGLEDQRAAGLSDREVKIILISVGAVLLLIILL